MDKELLDKIAYAREIIFEVEKREKDMQHSRGQVCLIQMEREKQKRKATLSYFVTQYFLWGLLVIFCGFISFVMVGGVVLPFLMPPENLKVDYLFKLALIGTALTGIIYTIIFIVRAKKKKKKNNEFIEQTIAAEISMKNQQVSTIQWCQEELKKVDFIPKEYQYGIAMDFFYAVLNNGRAENLKDCMNLYEEQVHRWKMERSMTNFQNMQAVQNARMNAMERELKWTKATADAAFIAHLF